MNRIKRITAIILIMTVLATFSMFFAGAEAANVLTFNQGDAAAIVMPDTVESDEVINVTLQPASAEGRTFSYWVDAKGKQYYVGQQVTVAGKVELTAVWDVVEEKQPNAFWQLVLEFIAFLRTLFNNIFK